MVTQGARIKYTYEDYRSTPENKRYQLLDGELIMTAAPRRAHQRAGTKLVTRLDSYVEAHDLGEVYDAPFDVVFSDTDVVQPDLLFVSKERLYIINDDNVRGAPDIVIEILSPSTASIDRNFKRALYARHGVKEFWLVDTDARNITVMLLHENGYEIVGIYGEGQTLTSPTLEGFTLNIGEIF
ncbi:MAG: Uma2 family endonuclease [Chloroflexi bacterium]|nr:Uma2 family endonuclease [Chloroflexota bacterium]MCY3638777.1 Uma2 family endonuclease [Chloroflexota bacterium]